MRNIRLAVIPKLLFESLNNSGWKWPLKIIKFYLFLKAGLTSKLDQVAWEFVLSSFEYLQGWKLCVLSGQPVLIFDLPYCESCLFTPSRNSPCCHALSRWVWSILSINNSQGSPLIFFFSRTNKATLPSSLGPPLCPSSLLAILMVLILRLKVFLPQEQDPKPGTGLQMQPAHYWVKGTSLDMTSMLFLINSACGWPSLLTYIPPKGLAGSAEPLPSLGCCLGLFPPPLLSFTRFPPRPLMQLFVVPPCYLLKNSILCIAL